MPKKDAGFTLIELLVVVAIIGILAAIAIPQYAAYRERGYNASAHSAGKNLATAEEAYFSTNYSYLEIPLQEGPKEVDSVGNGTGVILVGSQLSQGVFAEVSASGNGVTGSFFTLGVSHRQGGHIFYYESDQGQWKFRLKNPGVVQADSDVTVATSSVDIIPDAVL